MTETPSNVDPNLILLEGIESFQKHAQQAVLNASREIIVLSDQLDATLYGQPKWVDLLSSFARSDRRASAKILVKNIKPLLDNNHSVLRLAKRLSSKIQVRELEIAPQNTTQAYLIIDRTILLYKHEDEHYSGFINYRAAPECKRICEEFIYLWEQYGKIPPDMAQLFI